MEPRVALVSMPWAPFTEPSLALGILKAELAGAGIASRVFHSNLGLLRHVTGSAYQQISMYWALNEFTFTGVIDPKLSSTQMQCLVERCVGSTDESDLQTGHPFRSATDLGRALLDMRHGCVPLYLAECAEEVLAYEPTMVGFTCMFDQTIASAALALLIRQKRPDVLIVFGGYALEGPPGMVVLRAFPQIDAIATGDGEPQIVPLARASIDRSRLWNIPGVVGRQPSPAAPRPQYQLESSPDPDYSDWFIDLERLQTRDRVTVFSDVLPIESSRGCWWGQKHHCVFCGIDEGTLSYRSKTPDKVVAMLARMRERYGSEKSYRFSDYIFPQNFIKEVLPRLAEVEPRYTLHCEIKANQNEERIKAFAAAGFNELQPGIESFDSGVLKVMDKGVTGIQNVYLLKLGYLHGIQINYNILYGLPGEQPEWYHAMIQQVPRLYHLTPPATRTEAIVTRFAPMQADPARFGSTARPRHHRCYDSLFSEGFLESTGFSLDDYAYYFDRYFDYDPRANSCYSMLVHEVDHWKRQHLEREVMLSSEVVDGRVRIRDSRFGKCKKIVLTPAESRVYLSCDQAPQLVDAMSRDTGLPPADLDDALERLDRKRLVWREGGRVLGLAIPDGVVRAHQERGWQKSWTSLYC